MAPPLPGPTPTPTAAAEMAAPAKMMLPKEAAARQAILAAIGQGDAAGAVELVKALDAEGLYGLNMPLACRLVDLCVESKAWHLVIEGLLRCAAFPLDTRMCLRILQACIHNKRWHPALALLHESMPRRGLVPAPEVYRAALLACGRCHESGEVVKLLNEMHDRGLLQKNNAEDVHALVLEAVKADAWDAALALCQEYFGTMEKDSRGPRSPHRPPVSETSLLLEAEMLETTIEACRRLLRESHRLNERATLRRMSKKLWGVVQQARREHGVKLKRRTWTALIQIASKAGKTYDISQMMEAMDRDGQGASPGGGGGRKAALQRCLTANDWTQARQLLQDMLASHERQPAPESDDVVMLVLECGLKGRLQVEALQLFEAWWDADLTFSPNSSCRILAVRVALSLATPPPSLTAPARPPPPPPSPPSLSPALQRLGGLLDRFEVRATGQRAILCNMVMEHMKVQGLVQEGFAFLGVMRALEIPRRTLTLLPLLKLCAIAGRAKELVQLVEEMAEKDDAPPNVQIYSLAIDAATRANMVEEAMRLFRTMTVEGLPVGEGTCIDLMSGLARKGNWSGALDLLQDIRSCTKRPPSRIVYTAAVNACGNGGAWEMAMMLMKRMEEEGISPNTYTFSSAIKACARAGKWEQAAALFAQMDERGVLVNEVTYTAILDAYAKVGRARDAGVCLEGMKERGLRPSTPHYTAVIDACSRNGEYREALRWLAEMKATNVPITRMTYSAAIFACGKGGAWDEAMRVLMEMLPRTGERPSSVSYMLAIDACGRSGQWPVAAYLWELIELTDAAELNQAALNSLICAMEDPAMKSIVAAFYQRSYDLGRVNHWSVRHFRTMDLHNFSRPLAKAALQHVVAHMVAKHGAAVMDEPPAPVAKEPPRRWPKRPTNSSIASTPWPENVSRHGYVQDPRNHLILVTGHGRYRDAGRSLLRGELADFLATDFDPPLSTEKVPFNPGRLYVPSRSLLAFVRAEMGRRREGGRGSGGGGDGNV